MQLKDAMEEMFQRGGCWSPDQAPHVVKPFSFRLLCLSRLCRAVSSTPDQQRGAGRAGGPAQSSSTTQGALGADRAQQQKHSANKHSFSF